MKKIFILSLFGLLLFSACADLDVTPKGVVGDPNLMGNEAGMEIYMAKMYSQMPFEDFKYLAQWGFRHSGWLNATGIEGTGEALNRDGICTTFRGEDDAYWGSFERGSDPAKSFVGPFPLLRDANHLLETLPNYRGAYSEARFNHYMGEAYYVRAMVFYAMAKRFGGVPLITKVADYPASTNELRVPRASEEDTWNQILADFDKAAELMEETSPKKGYSNKYVALAYKSEAMLYAGSVAKYNQTVQGNLTGLGRKTGVRVMGFASDRWQEASKKYFSEAYKAAHAIIASGKYSLYKKKWSATDRNAQYQNMVDMLTDLTSPENIFVKEYLYPTSTHSYDSYSAPIMFHAPLSGGVAPTLDFVELFDGFDRYPDGTIKVTTGSSNTEGHYIMYDNAMDFYKNAEPRLRSYVIFPGDVFRGKVVEMRAGIFTGTEPISPLYTDYSYSTATSDLYQKLPAAGKSLYLSPDQQAAQVKVPWYAGDTLNAAGENGPFYGNGGGSLTGLLGRKWLNPDASFVALEGNSAQPFILMRYAEVLLNAAEAGVELAMAGGASPDGSNMTQVATDAIKDIRERAGANPLTSNITADETGRNTVRKERRKELAFDNITKWDLRRWRVQHYDGRIGFWGENRDKDKYSSSSRYRFRGLYPFLSKASKKWFFDAHFQWINQKEFEYNPVDYYFGIPGDQVVKSPLIDQQPNRN